MLSSRSRALLTSLLCCLPLPFCIVAAHPALQMGINDDWSYIWSARVLSETGHVVYNGWATAMLGWQLYWGALFIKMFGFSFTVLRISTLLVALVTLMLLQRLFLRMGINHWNSVVATLVLGLSPLMFPLAFSFMSDIPGLSCLILCFYACVRAMQAETDRAALGWLTFAALSNVTGGTVRQVTWLGALVVVPSTAWWIRQRRGAVATGFILWVVSAVAIRECLHWFALQPFSISEKMLVHSYGRVGLVELASNCLRGILSLGLLLLPVLLVFLFGYPFQKVKARSQMIAAGGAVLLVAVALVLRHRPVYWLVPFHDQFGSYVNARGMLDIPSLVGRPQETYFPVTLKIAITLLLFLSFAATVLFIWNEAEDKARLPARSPHFSWGACAALLGPFTLGYTVLIMTRQSVYDRYLLPLVFVCLVALIRCYEWKSSPRLPALCLVAVAVFAVAGVASMHDLFATDRARLGAADEILASGIPRSKIRAGFEYDAWTQLELAGYVNDQRLHNPPGAFHDWSTPEFSAACTYWFSSRTPSITPRYGLSYDTTTCFAPSTFAPVKYETWFPPHERTVYVRTIR